MPFLSLNVANSTDCSQGCTITESAGVYSLVAAPHDHSAAEVSWILLCAFLVVSMQLGFAMLEVGSCRQAHRSTVLAKNVLDSAISMIAFWIFCEIYNPLLVRDEDGRVQNHLVVFHWAFCSNAVTICSGSMAERTHMVAYLTYAIVMSGVIYPFVAGGAWSNEGPLRDQFNGILSHTYHDFAGSGVVHLVGGCSALVGNMLLGRRIMQEHDSFPSDITSDANSKESHAPNMKLAPSVQCELAEDDCPTAPNDDSVERRGRADDSEEHTEDANAYVDQTKQSTWPRRFDDAERDEREFRGLHYLQAMGMFTLWVGWYGFNAGSTLAMDRAGSITASVVALNTTLGAGAGALGSYMYCYVMQSRQLNLPMLCNGVLCGLVSITGACDVATKYAAVVIGLISSAVIFPMTCYLMRICRLDDPVDAIPVHASCGLFGVLAVAFCRPDCAYLAELGSHEQGKFCSPSHHVGSQLTAQAWGAFIEMAWTGSISLMMWGVFALCESALAIEDDILEQVYSVAFKMALADPQNLPYTELSAVMKNSPMAMDIFEQNGWADGCFKEEEHQTPSHLLRICQSIQQAREQNVKSALEIRRWKSVRSCSGLLRKLNVHWVVKLRLRILPANELSGLGVCDIDGGRVLRKAKHLILHMDREAKSANKATTAMLQSEIQELNTLVRSQDVLLQALAKRGRSRRVGPQGQMTPQSVSDGSLSPVSSGFTPNNVPFRVQVLESVDEQHVRNLTAAVTGSSMAEITDCGRDQSSFSTVSSRSGGQLSFHSEADSTPPPSTLHGVTVPTVIGRESRERRHRGMGVDPNAMNHVALQLIEVVRDQQRLLSELQTAPSHHYAGGVSPPISTASGSTTAFLPPGYHSHQTFAHSSSVAFTSPPLPPEPLTPPAKSVVEEGRTPPHPGHCSSNDPDEMTV